VHRVRQTRHPEDLQEQVQLSATRVPLSRGPSAQGVPLPGMRQGILTARQDEEPHEDRARLLHAQRLRHALRFLSVWRALAGGARARWAADRTGGGSEAREKARCHRGVQRYSRGGQGDDLQARQPHLKMASDDGG